MLFAGEDGEKKVQVLSGGEKVRVLLSRMMIQGANVLVFDDPTNHLDMESITSLNNALIKFDGVIIFTSHDHQFIQTIANRIMEILPDGTLVDKLTTYEEYLASVTASERDRALLNCLRKLIKGDNMPAGKKAKTKKVSNTKKSTAKLEQKKSSFKTEVFFLLAFGILILLILSNFGLAGVVGVGIKA